MNSAGKFSAGKRRQRISLILQKRFRQLDSVNRCRDDSTCAAAAFTADVQILHGRHQRFRVAFKSDRTGNAGFDPDAITYLPEDVTYIGSTSSLSRRTAEHKCNIRKTGGYDAGAYFGDSNLDNYKFEY